MWDSKIKDKCTDVTITAYARAYSVWQQKTVKYIQQ